MTQTLTIVVDGVPVPASDGQSVAAALIAAGWASFGPHAKTGAPLAPYCMMGVCFGCLCEVDGRPGAQACLIEVRDGLNVRLGAPVPE